MSSFDDNQTRTERELEHARSELQAMTRQRDEEGSRRRLAETRADQLEKDIEQVRQHALSQQRRIDEMQSVVERTLVLEEQLRAGGDEAAKHRTRAEQAEAELDAARNALTDARTELNNLRQTNGELATSIDAGKPIIEANRVTG